jgi:D-alanine-D-alanine ligase
MDPQRISVFYDAAEDVEKQKAEKEGKPFPLAYAQVAEALEKRGHKVRTVAVNKKIGTLIGLVEKDESDVIFNLCEAIAATPQHEHAVIGLLELYGKCFTGCGSAAYVLAADKALCKKILAFHGIHYPRFCTVDKGKVDWSDDLEFPLIVKPLNEDASLGIDKGSVVHNVKELLERIAYVQTEFNGAALVEEYIEGREIYVGVLGNGKAEALPLLEWDLSGITDGPKIAGAEAKWDRTSEGYKAKEVFPEDIPPEVVKQIQDAAVTAYEALKLSGYARVDMRVRGPQKDKSKKIAAEPAEKKTDAKEDDAKAAPAKIEKDGDWNYRIIEVNPNCWLEKRSEFAMAARKHGISYPDLLERIVELALVQRTRASAPKA